MLQIWKFMCCAINPFCYINIILCSIYLVNKRKQWKLFECWKLLLSPFVPCLWVLKVRWCSRLIYTVYEYHHHHHIILKLCKSSYDTLNEILKCQRETVSSSNKGFHNIQELYTWQTSTLQIIHFHRFYYKLT